MAERLYISRRTVQTHVSPILSKLRIISRGEIVVYAANAAGQSYAANHPAVSWHLKPDPVQAPRHWWRPHSGEVALFNPGLVVATRYGPRRPTIPSPWPGTS
ncbi:LuxR C-terminal-related transcriptional regulator [Streptomyces sioyaensis]|uniref:LuxR C-terminal-related transcriptional regulator n=1 Tax=Streptomyces sioyaensis TaxID=67364 RepID=UPI0036E53DA0